MDRFSKQIAVGNEMQLFEFTMMRNSNGVKCFITTKDQNQKPIAFSVKKKDDEGWKLVPGSLRWLYDIEDELSEAIIETRTS